MKQAIKSLLDRDYRSLETACHKHGTRATSLLERCLTASTRHEREHRAMGKRFLAGIKVPQYALSVDATARYYVLRAFWEAYSVGLCGKLTPLDAAELREDILVGAALRQLLDSSFSVPFTPNHTGRPICLSIDYAGEIAFQ